jgi:hypothetical protein
MTQELNFYFAVVQDLVDRAVPATIENIARLVPAKKHHGLRAALATLVAEGRLEAQPVFATGQRGKHPMYVHYLIPSRTRANKSS